VRHPVLAQIDTQSISDALKFALAQWSVYDWHLILRNERTTWIGENLRYTRVKAIERYVASAVPLHGCLLWHTVLLLVFSST
jgi:hypothetical protein